MGGVPNRDATLAVMLCAAHDPGGPPQNHLRGAQHAGGRCAQGAAEPRHAPGERVGEQ